LEIGLGQGGSLQIWSRYFHPASTIVGLDIDPACSVLAEEGYHIVIGDQADEGTLEKLRELGPFDIILDDGSHVGSHQHASFFGLWQAVRPGGIYVIEDTHTAYRPECEGGLRRPGTAVELAKNMLDALHIHHIPLDQMEREDKVLSSVHSTVAGVHAYDSVVVFERRDPCGPPLPDVMHGNQRL